MRITHWFCLLGLLLFLPTAALAYGYYTVHSTVPADVYVDNQYRATISASQTLKLILSGPQSYVIGVRAKETGQTHKEAVNVGADQNEHREIHAFVIPPAGYTPQDIYNSQGSRAEVTVYSNIPADVYIDNVLQATIDSTQPMTINLPGPRMYVFEVQAKESNLIFREKVDILPNSTIKREIRAFLDSPIPAVTPVTEVAVDGAATTATPVVATTPQGSISREEMASEIQKATAQAKAEALAEEAARRKRAEKRELTTKGIAHVVGVEANQGLPGSVKNMERIKLLLEALPSFKK